MKVTEFHSYYQADCAICGEMVIVGRAELSDAVEQLFKGRAVVDLSLTCRCQLRASGHVPGTHKLENA